ncbi:MAG TPA: alpha-amylase family glycosyl hydrolase [Anaerolineales bacterium]|nr:alpha-amylase family glycosyl hydrolase [Anaerolineales bacterium]
MNITTPSWVHNAVFYQIFPDRFARSARTPHPRGLQFKPWGADPAEQGFQGGDLYGIAEKLDYLKDLGITALYLNPIFASASNHRYHAFDYRVVDPLLGGDAGLRELLDQAHARNIRVVLDFVPNHASRGFWAFHHILETGGNSPYIDWFTVYKWPLRPYNSSKTRPPNYAAWWNNPALPKINVRNPGARDYLMGVAKQWLEFGIDGWRIDVAEEIDDDSFWHEFRALVKATNPEAYTVAEIWHEAKHWLQGDMFDAVMNYFVGKAAVSFFASKSFNVEFKHPDYALQTIDAKGFAEQIDTFLGFYDWQINLAQLNMLDSHDTPRALWLMGEDKSALRLSVLFQMTMPGAPNIYYGDEIGMTGGPDPDCRRAFLWDQPETWDHDLREFYKQAIALRHAHPVLRTGGYADLYAKGEVIAYGRRLGHSEAVVVFNADHKSHSATIPLDGLEATSYTQVWPVQAHHTYAVEQGKIHLTIPPRSAIVMVSHP